MANTSLSAGLMLYSLLNGDEGLKKKITKVFPVVTDNATLPYIAYRRTAISRNLVKGGGADTVSMEVGCFADTYAGSVELAEQVRGLLDGVQHVVDGDSGNLVLRSCSMVDGSESYEGDAYCQTLVFEMKINNSNN